MQSGQRIDIPALTGLRFIAAMMVVIGHSAVSLRALAPNAMAPFFVLSGFMMWLNYADDISRRKPGALAHFAVARIARLWPMYLVALLLAVLISGIPRTIASGPDTLYFLVGLQSWLPVSGTETLAILIRPAGHLWSISVELFLYCCFPLLVILLARLRDVSGIAIVAILNIIAATMAYHWLYFHAPLVSRLGPDALMWLSYYAPYFHLFEFIAGCTACQLFFAIKQAPAQRPMNALAVLSVAVLALIVTLFAIKDSFGEWYIDLNIVLRVGPLLPLSFLMFYLARYESWMSRALAWRWIMLGGEASYSIYLLQPFAADRLHPAIAIPTTLAVAFISYRLVEVPARRWLRASLTSLSMLRHIEPIAEAVPIRAVQPTD